MYTDTTIQKYLGFFTFPMFTNNAFIWKNAVKTAICANLLQFYSFIFYYILNAIYLFVAKLNF